VLAVCKSVRVNWDDFRFLLALRRSGSLVRAASQLGVSHTTAGRRVASLEAALGTRLVNHTRAGLHLTPAALEMAERVQAMEDIALGIERSITGEDTRLAGRVRVTATEALGGAFLTPHLVDFRRRHPEIEVELISETRILSLARREAEVAVRLLRPMEPTSVGRRVGVVAFAPYAALDYRRRRRSGRSSVELVGYDATLAGPETDWLSAKYPGAAFAFRSNSTRALVSAAVAGMGIAMLPCFLGDAEPSLTRLAAADEAPPYDVWLVVHRDVRRTARVAKLVEHLGDVFRKHGRQLRGAPAGTS
jgi:DNA-binding transcriptional LysR family regulator